MGRPIQIFLSVFLILTVCTSHAQPINWDSIRAAYVTKYQPQRMPAWLFPIIFEEGTGQRDTIYLGYDPNAQDLGWPLTDTIFGERYWPVDTGRFNAVWSEIVNDSAFKSVVRLTFNNALSISFYNGLLPLKMYWNREAFYSDSLPFPDQGPAPRAQGEVGFTHPMTPYSLEGKPTLCNDHARALLTDSITYDFGCIFSDSLGFKNTFGGGQAGYLWSFKITPWTGTWVGVDEVSESIGFKIFPNPAKEYLQIEPPGTIPYTYQVYTVTGKLLRVGKRTGAARLETGDLAPGYYLINIITADSRQTFHLIVSL